MKFSASMIKTWMGCPLQAKFQEIDQLPRLQNGKASYGTCIHEALQQYNEGATIEATIERFKETWYNPELLGVKPDYWPKMTTYTGLLKKGVETLQDYHDIHEIQDRTVIATEHRFLVPFGDHELSGIVDLLEVGKDNSGNRVLRVVDYKSNSKAPTQITLAADIQFTIYIYATTCPEFWLGNPGHPDQDGNERYQPMKDGQMYFDTLSEMERRGVWYHLNTNKEIAVGRRDDFDYQRLYRCLNEIENAIEKEVYVPNISGETCTYCSYRESCPVMIPIVDRLEEEIEPL